MKKAKTSILIRFICALSVVYAMSAAAGCNRLEQPNAPLSVPPTSTFTPTVTPTPFPTCAVSVNIPDSNLKKYMLNAAGKPSTGCDLCADDLPKISSMYISDPVSDFTGLSLCSAVKSLGLYWQGKTALPYVGQISGITALICYNSGLEDSDLANIAGLNSLVSLDLTGNTLTSLGALNTKPALKDLYINYNAFTRLDSLAAAPNLERLFSNSNYINDISYLANLPALTRAELAGNQITDITAVEGLMNLNYFGFSYNQVADISALTRNVAAGGMKPGSSVLATGNPLNSAPDVSVYLPYLASHGISVYY